MPHTSPAAARSPRGAALLRERGVETARGSVRATFR
ncbi:hypothetical protein QFZ82_006220 [Streptomyces sp. V4I23]|nr:hypothetical protein [Streptomyces sp. V4I23]